MTYFEHPAKGSTALRIAGQLSVAHALAREAKDTKATKTGTLIHTALLEPDKLSGYEVGPQPQCSAETKSGDRCSRRAVAGDVKCRQHGGAEVPSDSACSEEEMTNAVECATAVRTALDRAGYGHVLEGVKAEVEVYRTASVDDDGLLVTRGGPGLPVKGKIDALNRSKRLAIDLRAALYGS